jgi:ABC-type branched-subunit amino acid transport system substrate-binding protein
VFALVGGVSAGADKELAALAAETGTPLVGPSTLLPQTGSPLNRYVFYLLPGFGEQARSLANFAAAKPELKKARLAVVCAEGELTTTAAAAFIEQAKTAGLQPVIRLTYTRGSFNAAQIVGQLKEANADALLFLGTNGEEATLLQAAAAAKWTPYVLLLGALTGKELGSAVSLSFKDRVFLAFPTVPTDITPEGVAEFRALQEKYKFPARNTASQLAALAAAKVFVEGLKRTGKDVSREQFITALEGLYEFDTGLTPRLTFGPNRRIGAAGASVATFDPEKKEFVLASGWVKAY